MDDRPNSKNDLSEPETEVGTSPPAQPAPMSASSTDTLSVTGNSAAVSKPVAAETDTPHQDGDGEAITRNAEKTLPGDSATLTGTSQHHRWTRRQVLTGIGVTVGVVGLGIGATLSVVTTPSGSGTTSPTSSPARQDQSPVSTQSTPLPLEQKLQAWQKKRLTATRTQRFQHQNGHALVPLGIVESTYPNPYNLYHAHVQGYVLGGTLVDATQFFLYLGLESVDGSQFVGTFRVGPIDQPADHFGIVVTQQSTDTIEGGPPDYPLVTLAPKAFYQALSSLVDHCLVVDLIRQPLPDEAEDVPQEMQLEITEQAQVSDQFLQVDFEAIHHTPLAHINAGKLAPIRHLIDTPSVTYTTPNSASMYPLVAQVVLRHSDQLFPKLVSGG